MRGVSAWVEVGRGPTGRRAGDGSRRVASRSDVYDRLGRASCSMVLGSDRANERALAVRTNGTEWCRVGLLYISSMCGARCRCVEPRQKSRTVLAAWPGEGGRWDVRLRRVTLTGRPTPASPGPQASSRTTPGVPRAVGPRAG
jgi:hypothetical protein